MRGKGEKKVKMILDRNPERVSTGTVKLKVPQRYAKKGFRISHLSQDPIVFWRFEKILFVLGSNTELQPRTLAGIFDHFLQLSPNQQPLN